jgi:hypothetical protein
MRTKSGQKRNEIKKKPRKELKKNQEIKKSN